MNFSIEVQDNRIAEIKSKLDHLSFYLLPLSKLSNNRSEWSVGDRMLLQLAYDTYNETKSIFECCPCEMQACNYIKKIAPIWLEERKEIIQNRLKK